MRGAVAAFESVDLTLLDVTTYADWIADAPDRTLVQRIVDDHGGSNRRITVGGSWILEPSINFYRITRRLDWIGEMERRPAEAGGTLRGVIRCCT